MAINKKLIYYNRTLSEFLSDANGLNGQSTKDANNNVGNIPFASIVFTNDGYIWTHGKIFNGNNTLPPVTSVNGQTGDVTLTLDNIADGSTRKLADYLPLSGGVMTGNISMNNHGYIASGRSTSYNYGYSFPTYNNDYSNSIGLFSGSTNEEGGVVVSPDICFVYNSSDSGYNFACFDKDLGGDFTTGNSLLFAVRQDQTAWSRGGFVKNGSSDSYVLLGGGGHKAVSDFVEVTGNQTISGNKTFSSSVSIDDLTIGNLVVNGAAPFLRLTGGTLTGSGEVLNLSNTSGGDIGIRFSRGSNTHWTILNSGGNLYFIDDSSGLSIFTIYENSQGSSVSVNGGSITSTKISNWDSVYSWYSTAAGSDPQGVINNWNEISNFIDGFHETDDLATYLVNTFVAKAGSTITGKISRNSGGAWISGRDNVVVEQLRTSAEGSDWHPVIGVKTSNGYWSMGSVGGESLCLSYDTDANYSAGSNSFAVINFPGAGSSGTLALVSLIPTDYLPLSGGTLTGATNFNDNCWVLNGNEHNDIINKHWANATLYDNTNTAPLLSIASIRNAIRFGLYNTYWNIGNIRGGSSNSEGFGIALEDTTNNRLIDCFRVTGDAAYVCGNTVIHSGNIGSQSVSYADSAGSATSSTYTGALSMPRTNGIDFNNYDSVLRGYLLNSGNGYGSQQGWLLDFAWDWDGHYTTQIGVGLRAEYLAYRGDNGDGTYSSWKRIIDDTNWSLYIGTSSAYVGYASYATSAGYAGYAEYANYTRFQDTRDTSHSPNDAAGFDGLRIDFKNKATSLIPSSGTWTSIITMDGYSDTSGGYPVQLGYSMSDLIWNNPLYYRSSISSSTWGQWRKILDSGTIGLEYTSDITYDPHEKRIVCSTVDWNWSTSSFWSKDGYSTDVGITFKCGARSQVSMIGLNTDPTNGHNYAYIDYCWYINDYLLYIYESGYYIDEYGEFNVGTELSIIYSGGFVKYYKDGVLCRTVARGISDKLYADSSFCYQGNIYDLLFGKMFQKNAGDDNQSINALLHSGVGRSDDAAGDTWLFIDDAGGYSSNWGIKHNQVDNLIEYYGSGSVTSYVDLQNGYNYVTRLRVSSGYSTALINTAYNNFAINFREGRSYDTGFFYGTYGNEFLALTTQQSVTSLIFGNGYDPASLSSGSFITGDGTNYTYGASTDVIQIKLNCVSIGDIWRHNVTPDYKLRVVGIIGVTNNGNTVEIGSRNSSWCYFENTADIPFYFNKSVHVDGGICVYGTSYNINSGTSVLNDLRVSGADLYIGSTSGSQCHLVYDDTNKCLKFIFD